MPKEGPAARAAASTEAASRPTDIPAPFTRARWQLRVLGGLSLADGQQHIDRLPSRAVAALLLRLALAPERTHAREELVELLWPGVELAVGRNRLRQALSTLKSLVEPPGSSAVLQADRLGVRLLPGTIDCDAAAFEADCRAGRFDTALLRYRGELLPGFYDDWIAQERLRLTALAERAQAQAAMPAATGGAAPMPRPAPPPERALLPAYLTRYFADPAQTGSLAEAVRGARLVTLTGTGGSGKTRLAVETAAALQAASAFDTLAFVPLAQCTDAAELPERLLAALRPGHGGGDLDALHQALGGRDALLVLDNLEQLLPAAALPLAALLAALPRLHVLATSRRRLELDGEHEWPVEPLALPPADATLAQAVASPAVSLFVDRARAARADFHLGARNAATLVALVRALEGLPLAIELAASRVRAIAPAEMLARLQGDAAGPTPALALLSRSGPRAGFDARHASMERVIAWSWDQLAAEDARLLAALTLFEGGFDAAAAAALRASEDTLLALDRLCAHSLLAARTLPDGTLRFALYEPIREFAGTRLAAAERALRRRALRTWWLAWAHALPATPPLAGLRREMPNLTATMSGALQDGVPDEAIDLAIALRRALADAGAPGALLQALAQAAEASADAGRRCQAHGMLAALHLEAGASARALAHAEQALALAPPHGPLRARVLHGAASVRWRTGRRAEPVAPLIAEALAEVGEDAEVRASLCALQAFIANQAAHDHARGEALHREAFALWCATGNRLAINAGRYNLAMCAHHARRWPEALAQAEAVARSAREDDDWRQESQALNLLGVLRARRRDWPGALAAYRDCVALAWRTAWPRMLAYGLWNAPGVLAHLRQPHAAARLMGFAVAYWQAHFGALGADDVRDLRRLRRLVACQIGSAAAAAAEAEGQALAPADAVQLLQAAAGTPPAPAQSLPNSTA